jgi:very-short-patch-repair endonuclease
MSPKQYTPEALLLMARLNREHIDFKSEAEFPRPEFNIEGKQKGFIADVLLRVVPLRIEVNGKIHEKWKVEEQDIAKVDWFQNRGIRTIAFTNFQVRHHLKDVVETIKTEMRRDKS